MQVAGTTQRELIETVAAEMTAGIDRAVGFWMRQVEDALTDSRLTTLGRLHAVQDVVAAFRLGTKDSENQHGDFS
jgi:hypothetical protein